MAEYVTQYKFAKLCGVSKQAVNQAVEEGRIIVTSRGIDAENPNNVYFREKAALRKAQLAAKKKAPPPAPKKKRAQPPAVKKEAKKPEPKKVTVPNTASTTFDMYQKAYEETRLKKIQADTAVLKYAKEADAVIDVETLKQKIGAFANFLLTHLIYMPEDISDHLWMIASGADEPEREIRKLLSERVEAIIQEAKAAASDVLPPDHDVKYVMIGMEDE
jgi:phage terminase Nu1 subunit (DNA packaging protein)